MNNDQRLRTAALAIGLAQCIEHAPFPPTGTSNRAHDRNDRRWLFDWNDDPAGGVTAYRDGYEINAYRDGRWFVSVNDSQARIVHDGRAKNPRLTTAMAAAERWWGINRDSLLKTGSPKPTSKPVSRGLQR